jgi:aspartate aminotransferase
MAVAQYIRESVSKSSWIRKMFEEGISLKKQYGVENVFDFSLGNPDLDPPRAFHDSLCSLAAEDARGSHGYMPNAGFVDVRKAIAEKVNREHGSSIEADGIVMSVGAAGALNVVFKTILNPGDEVIVIKPYFVEYGSYIANHGGKIVPVNSSTDFSLDCTVIEKALTSRTAAVLINSPNNPTGRIYSAEQIKSLGKVLQDHKTKTGKAVYCIADEPYREIAYDDIKVPSIMPVYDHSIVVTSYSKSLSLPGERIGYIAVNSGCDDREMLISGLVMCTRTLGFVNAPALMQRVVAKLTNESVDVSIYQKRRDIFAAGLTDAGFTFAKPEGAFYFFCKAPIDDDVKFVNYLKDCRILSVPGSGFGTPGYFRLAYCVEDDVIARSIPVFKSAMANFSEAK